MEEFPPKCSHIYSNYHKNHIISKKTNLSCSLEAMKEVYFLNDGYLYTSAIVLKKETGKYFILSVDRFGEYYPYEQYYKVLINFSMGWSLEHNNNYFLFSNTVSIPYKGTTRQLFVLDLNPYQYKKTDELFNSDFAHILKEENIAFINTEKESFLFDLSNARRLCDFPSSHLYQNILSSALSPNNKLRAIVTTRKINGSNTHIIDVASGKIIKSINIPTEQNKIIFAGNKMLLLRSQIDGFYLWNFEKDESFFFHTDIIHDWQIISEDRVLLLHYSTASIFDLTAKSIRDSRSLKVDKIATSIYIDNDFLIVSFYGSEGLSFFKCQ
jgi:hypothetical protein